jgi:Polysaccharide biosynthesis enzyme WcbI
MVPNSSVVPIWSLSGIDFVVNEINSKAPEGFIWITTFEQEKCDAIVVRLARKPSRIIQIPEIFFDAFHPDMTYVQLRNGILLESALGHYHSKISLWLHLNGVKPVNLDDYYNFDVYKKLGYLSKYQESKQNLYSSFTSRDLNVDYAKEITSHGDMFMHTFNHPKINLLSALAESVCEKLEVDPAIRHFEVNQVLRDALFEAGPIYPVYPEIASFFGRSGSYLSRRQDGRVLNLSEFTSESFGMYSKVPIEEFNEESLFNRNFHSVMSEIVRGK